MSITSNSNWKHVKTEDNPAAVGTRVCTIDELIENDLRWHGSTWLSQPSLGDKEGLNLALEDIPQRYR